MELDRQLRQGQRAGFRPAEHQTGIVVNEGTNIAGDRACKCAGLDYLAGTLPKLVFGVKHLCD